MSGMGCWLSRTGRVTLGILGVAGAIWAGSLRAEVCTTQAKMSPGDRDTLVQKARTLGMAMQAGDAEQMRAATVPELAKDFSGMAGLVGSTAPKLKGGALAAEQVYLLDASTLKAGAGGALPDAQFFCTLNGIQSSVDFTIPGLPPGRYGFAMVRVDAAAPWRLSFLLRQDGGQWRLAGLYPKPLTMAGHDGLWYWMQARTLAKDKHPWVAYLYYGEAGLLLQPANFVTTTHLEKLQTEVTAAAPPALSEGLSGEVPLVVKGPNGSEYRFTGLGLDDSLATEKPDVIAHLKVDAVGDPVAGRKRNADAMVALLTAYPELRQSFHGVWMVAETSGAGAFPTEQAMADIH